MRVPSDEMEELDTTYWQKTYEKQLYAQLKCTYNLNFSSLINSSLAR
jgi:hypothetical protein